MYSECKKNRKQLLAVYEEIAGLRYSFAFNKYLFETTLKLVRVELH